MDSFTLQIIYWVSELPQRPEFCIFQETLFRTSASSKIYSNSSRAGLLVFCSKN